MIVSSHLSGGFDRKQGKGVRKSTKGNSVLEEELVEAAFQATLFY